MSARAGQLTLIRCRSRKLQQCTQGAGSDLMEGDPQRILDRLQIGAAGISALGEDAAQQVVYFPRNFFMDCSSRFFS